MSKRNHSRPPQITRLVQLALDRHQNGDLREAKRLYDQILRVEPGHADALHFSGLIAHQRGDNKEALVLLMRAIEQEPTRAVYFVNLGQVLEASGECGQAIENYRQATLLDPGLEAAHHRLGDALLKGRQLDAAAASYSRALSIEPNSPQTINSLGSLLYEAGRLEQAVVCYRKAIAIQADYAEAHNNLGIALKHLGQLAEGIASCTRALQSKPALAAAHSNLGDMLVARGDFEQALECLLRAIALQPDFAQAYLNLGNAYRGLGLLSKAIENYERAILLSPNAGGAYNNLAETYKDQGKLDQAVESFKKALAAKPGFAPAYSNLLHLYAFTRYLSPEAARVQAEAWERSMLSEDQRAAARRRASPRLGTFPVRSAEGKRLKLGIVSAELGSHAVAQFLLPFLQQLDRSRFHLTLFPTARRFCTRAEEFKNLAERYLPLTELSDAGAAELIRSEQIDVLMDTTGHTFGGRPGIFAHRAAPVQCTYIGYWGTTGLTEMDWIFADANFPQSMEAHFCERVWRLPCHPQCYQGETSLPESGWVPDPTGTIWLGSFNKLSKIREPTLCLWARVLAALPEAKLIFEDGARHEEETHQRILTTLSRHGVEENRVAFIPFVAGHERHMVLYDRLDIALDTLPFNSGTTAYDALWMGVPLVTLESDWSGGRASEVLKAFDRPEWVAQDEEEYVAIVCSLAKDVARRSRERKSQRARMMLSPLCDAKAVARAMENALTGMYQQWTAGAGKQ